MKSKKHSVVLVVSLVIVVFAVIAAHAAIITTGLVGRWVFNEGSGIVANDSSGQSNNGTLMNSAYFITNDPQKGNVLNVNGAYGEVVFPYTTELQPVNGTVSVWVKPTVAQTADIVHLDTDKLIQCNRGGPWYAYDLRIDSKGTPYAILANDDPKTCGKSPQTVISGASGSVNLNQWNHMAMTWGNGKVALYVNGKLSKSTSYVPEPNLGLSYSGTNRLLASGGQFNYDNGFMEFYGEMSDLRVYNQALSATQINAIATLLQ